MNEQQLFRWIFVAIFVITISISIYFRRQARQAGAAPLYLSILAYMINPDWMSWSTLRVRGWMRWLAALVGMGMLPMLYWQMRSISRNISETFPTKKDHVLVPHGPYRWIRHPLYAVSTVILVALSLVAANGFMLAMAVLSIFIVAFFVIIPPILDRRNSDGPNSVEFGDDGGFLVKNGLLKRQNLYFNSDKKFVVK